jgi:hypothetical protein
MYSNTDQHGWKMMNTDHGIREHLWSSVSSVFDAKALPISSLVNPSFWTSIFHLPSSIFRPRRPCRISKFQIPHSKFKPPAASRTPKNEDGFLGQFMLLK